MHEICSDVGSWALMYQMYQWALPDFHFYSRAAAVQVSLWALKTEGNRVLKEIHLGDLMCTFEKGQKLWG